MNRAAAISLSPASGVGGTRGWGGVLAEAGSPRFRDLGSLRYTAAPGTLSLRSELMGRF